MHHLNRRARRALTPLALAALVASAAPAVVDAAGPRPKVDVRVRQRTLIVEGGRADDTIRVFSPAARPFDVVVTLGLEGDVVVASVHRDRFDDVVVRGGDGNDLILLDDAAGGNVPFTDTKPTSIRGDGGDDVISSGSGAEDLRGGAGFDVIDGNKGNDVVALGAGDDRIIWDQGDGSDTVEGGAGLDGMTFNGAPFNETFAAAADGERLRFTRVQGNIVMDTDGVEEVTVNTLGGSDFTEVGDLTGTDVTVVGVDDGLIAGGDGPDAVVDTVSVIGAPRADHFALTGGGTLLQVQGLSTRVDVVDLNRFDTLNVISDRGADTIDASGVTAEAPHLALLSGPGNDVVLGGAGIDDVLAGPGRDVVDANRGDDRIGLDEGDDEIIWDPGDGSDLVDGSAGFDVMTFNGAAGNEVMEASALDDGLIVTRDVGDIRMDTERLERLDVNALGGTDTVTVGDLAGTTVEIVALDLAAVRGTAGGDGAADHVVVLGTPGDDVITAFGAGGAARIDDLPWSIDIVNSEPLDVLTIDGNGGEDSIDTAGLGPDTIQPAPIAAVPGS